MSSYMKLHTAETTMLLIFVCSFGFLMATTALLPKSIGPAIGAIGYFVIILVGFLFMELYCREMANPYPYYMTRILPSNEIIHLFTLPDKTRKLEMGEYQAAYFPLAYECDVPAISATGEQVYLKTNKVLIHYRGEWTSHVHLRPGVATYRGYNVKHPATEIIDVRPLEHSPFSNEFQESVPVFQLIMGSQDIVPDVDTENIDMKAFDGKDGRVNSKSIKAILLQNKTLKSEVAEANRRANEYQQKCHALINENVQQRNDNSGLKQAITAAAGLALEKLLSALEACNSIEKAARMLKGSTWDSWIKYIFITIIAISVLLFLYFDPSVGAGIMNTLNNPIVVGAIAIVAIFGIFIFLRMRKK